MNSITESIAATMKLLSALADIIQREPAFNHWHFPGSADPSLVQLFPTSDILPVAQRQEQAKAIARAFGGTWKRDVCDGSWRNEGGSFRVVLHRVDTSGRVESAIDLTVPQPVSVVEEKEPVRDEIPAHHTAEREAVSEARDIERYGMPEPGLS